jgi:hypothetical protein
MATCDYTTYTTATNGTTWYTMNNSNVTYGSADAVVTWSNVYSPGTWTVGYDSVDIPAAKREMTLEDVINDCVRELRR